MSGHKENYCAECSALATKELDSLSVCADCFKSLNAMFDNEAIAANHISGMFEEGELNMLVHLSEVFNQEFCPTVATITH